MFSDVVKSGLERDVVGQTRAVNAVVRGVTRVASGLTPRERALCAYLFIGPTGTGKTHLVRSLATMLHGDARRMAVCDCTHFIHGDPWMAVTSQLTPLFQTGGTPAHFGSCETPPLSIVLIEYLDRAPQEVARALAVALETGGVLLPDGRRGLLRNCMIFLTSNLCSSQILDETTPIGFQAAADEEESDEIHARLEQSCHEQAEKQFGSDLVGRLDGLVVFHRLRNEDLSAILDRRLARLNLWLRSRSFRCELLPAARGFLLERGRRDLRLGAHDLNQAHQRYVEFPVADMMISGRIGAGSLVLVDRRPDERHLHFTVTRQEEDGVAELGRLPAMQEIPVAWATERPTA